MKKLIYALVAIMCGVCAVNAGELQEWYCGDKSLSYCIKHYDKQCNAKNYGACSVVGALYSTQKKYYEANKYDEMVCNKAHIKDIYQIELIDGNLTKGYATEIIKIVCSNIAKNYYFGKKGVKQDFVKSLQYSNKACDAGDGFACFMLARQYNVGEGTKENRDRFIDLLIKSCELEFSGGCAMIGMIYQESDISISEAKKYYRKACELGYKDSCNDYNKINRMGVK